MCINRQPPYIRDLWRYLNENAAKRDNGTLKKGQLQKSYNDIIEDTCWYVGARKEKYTRDQVKRAFSILRRDGLVNTSKELGHVTISICSLVSNSIPKSSEITTKEPTKTPKSFYQEELKETNHEGYHKFVKWLYQDNDTGKPLTKVLGMQGQISFNKFMELTKEHPSSLIASTILNLENDNKKKYKSFLLTLKNWLSRASK